jgi:lipoprotein
MKFRKLLSAGLGIMMFMSMFACSEKGNTNSTSDTASVGGSSSSSMQEPQTPQNIVTDPTMHYQNGLHKINVKKRDMPFITEGESDYKIVAKEKADESANMLRLKLESASGEYLDIVTEKDVSWSEDEKLIVIGSDSLFKAAGLTMPPEDLGETGYYLVSKGKSVFIMGHSEQALTNGSLEFLKHTVGYEMYSADTTVYWEGNTFTLPEFNIIDKPDFEFFIPSNALGVDGIQGMRFMITGDIFIPVEGLHWHNSFGYLDPDDYPDNPEWFAEKSGADKQQLCYTAHGDQDALDSMLDEFMKKMISAVDGSPNVANITITIEDNHSMCQCDACKAELKKYGTQAGAVIKFCNKVAERLDKHLEEKAAAENTEKRNVNILFFAYNETTDPPVKKVNGEFVPIDDSIICHKNVGVYIAPITAAYNKSFYDIENRVTAEQIQGWAALSDKLYMWLYETNYSHYFYPLNSYDAMLETFRFCKENNAIFMFSEGQFNQGNVTAFGKLKEYFNSKAMWNVNVSYDQIVNDFFENYFREAAPMMRSYFEELQLQLEYLEKAYPADVNGNIYNNIAQARFWPKKMLDGWLKYIDEAYKAIELYRTENPTLYATLERHIRLESIFPRFALITLHSGMYSSDDLSAMRLEFYEDCNSFDITRLSETVTLDATFESWGL